MQFDFLLCSERSGSNLLTRILGTHSQISAPATTHIFRLLFQNERRYGDLTDDRNWVTLLQDTVDLLDARLGDWKTEWSMKRLRSAADRASAADRGSAASGGAAAGLRSLSHLLRTVYEAEAAASGKQRLFVKEIEVYDFLSRLRGGFPGAKYIHLVRDPRDMALSWKKSAAIRGGVVRAAKTWLREQRAYGQRTNDANDGSCLQVHHTTYEQVVADPTVQLAAICRFLGVRFEPRQLGFHESEDAHNIANSAIDFANIKRPLMTSNFGNFRKGLSEPEIAYIELTCGVEMQRYGYATESAPQRYVLKDLESELLSREPHIKSAYDSASAAEKRTRSKWMAVAKRIRSRSIA